ncbi:hypothetical protein [Alkalihalobacterium bogoriense]|uniref:hypothetical protein n=1 Tax=Alkalihalobacterium bogoriense TaxID=246272 RepID=UPI00047AF8B7|nr:hypothetical protein [Alkalihalobacterium bogoriense]
MIGWLNIGSLVLGLIAWILPVVVLMRKEKSGNNKLVVFSIWSFSCCGVALCFQMYYNYHLVIIEDWSALMDTMGGVAVAATVLLVVTIALNTMTLVVNRKKAN